MVNENEKKAGEAVKKVENEAGKAVKKKFMEVNGEMLEIVDEADLPVFDPGAEGHELTEQDWLLMRYGLTGDIEVNGIKLKAP